MESSNLLTHLPGCIDFITKALAGGGKVLVHCAAGVSRSTTVREALSQILRAFLLHSGPARVSRQKVTCVCSATWCLAQRQV